MEAESKVFGDLQKCLNQSYELADACVSIIEAKLSLKGYEPSPISSAEAAKFSTEGNTHLCFNIEKIEIFRVQLYSGFTD